LKKLLALNIAIRMSLLDDENAETGSDSSNSKYIETVKVSKCNPRVTSCRRIICSVIGIIIFTLLHYLYYNSRPQNYLKKTISNPFEKTRVSYPTCCENRYACWMQCLGKEIAFTPLNRLVIPGTHNSGVYSSAFEARIRDSHNLSHIVRDEFRTRVEKFVS